MLYNPCVKNWKHITIKTPTQQQHPQLKTPSNPPRRPNEEEKKGRKVKKHLGRHQLYHMPIPVPISCRPLLPRHPTCHSVLDTFVIYPASFQLRLVMQCPPISLTSSLLLSSWSSALAHSIIVFSSSAHPSPCPHSPALARSGDGTDLVVEGREGGEVRNNRPACCRIEICILSGVLGHGKTLRQ